MIHEKGGLSVLDIVMTSFNSGVTSPSDDTASQKFHFGKAQQPANKRAFTGIPFAGQARLSRQSLSRPVIPLARKARTSMANGHRSSLIGAPKVQSSVKQDLDGGNRSNDTIGISDTDIDERVHICPLLIFHF